MFKRKKTNSTSINTKSVNLNSKKLKQKSTRLNYESLRLQLEVAKISIDRLENGEGIQKIELPSPKQPPEVPGPSTSKAASSRKVKPKKVPPPKTFLVKAPPSKGKGRFSPMIQRKDHKMPPKKAATGTKTVLLQNQLPKEPLIGKEEVEHEAENKEVAPIRDKKTRKLWTCYPRRTSVISDSVMIENKDAVLQRKGSFQSRDPRTLASTTSSQNRGWKLVKDNLSRIVEYGVSHGIIPPRYKRTAIVEDDRDDEDDPEANEAKKKGYLNIPVSPDDSIFHSAIPFLPLSAAIPCFILNFILPGFGTILSGLCVLCMGQPRIHYKTGRLGSTVMVNSVVGVCQLATITFMLVGWFWSIAWGGLIIIHAIEYNKAIVAERKENVATLALQALTKNGVVRKRDLKGFVQSGSEYLSDTICCTRRSCNPWKRTSRSSSIM